MLSATTEVRSPTASDLGLQRVASRNKSRSLKSKPADAAADEPGSSYQQAKAHLLRTEGRCEGFGLRV